MITLCINGDVGTDTFLAGESFKVGVGKILCRLQ